MIADRLVCKLICFSLVVAELLIAQESLAFTGEDDFTPGAEALRYNRRAQAWSRFDLGAVDGRIKTSPPDSVTLDRRIDALLIAGVDVPIGPGFGLRLNADASYSRQRQLQQSTPQATIDQTLETFTPSADLTYVTFQGLELFAGAEDQIAPAYTKSVATTNGVSSSHYHKTSVVAPRGGVVRRTGNWSGGFYYQAGARETRDVDQHAFDATYAATTDEAFVPSVIAVMGAFKALASAWNFELDFVEARDLGPQDVNHNALYTDYLKVMGGATFSFGVIGLNVATSYQTQAYGNSAYVTLDTIPTSTLRLLLLVGDASNHVNIGVIGAYGKDGQSLPEFNATYQMFALAGTLGFSRSW